jgi:hypothetical protein
MHLAWQACVPQEHAWCAGIARDAEQHTAAEQHRYRGQVSLEMQMQGAADALMHVLCTCSASTGGHPCRAGAVQ